MTEAQIQAAIASFEADRTKYEQAADSFRRLIEGVLSDHHDGIAQLPLEFRTKDVSSLRRKLLTRSKDVPSLESITDLCGVRIVCFFQEDVAEICDVIEREFDVDWENSIDKSNLLEPNTFGYQSVHYVVRLNDARMNQREYAKCVGHVVEIQVRTVLQHAWAAIDHKLRYKTEHDVPDELKRDLFRLSALLELADKEFSAIRVKSEEVSLRYEQKIGIGDFKIGIDSDSW